MSIARRICIAAAAAVAVAGPAAAQSVEIGADQPCTAAFSNAHYPALGRFVPKEAAPAARAGIRGVVVRSITWRPGETIKICFRSGTQKARARVAEHASEWMKYANLVLDFGEAGNLRSCGSDNTDAIKIDFVERGPAGGYWSQVGTNSRKVQHSMNLGQMGRDELPFPEAEARRLTQHEFGHALGLLHEHQSPKSNCGVEYYEEALLAYGALLGWTRDRALSNFVPYSDSVELNASEVDRKSIMHYSLPPWLFKAGDKSPCFVKPNYDISEGDKAFMARVYPKPDVVATRSAAQPTAAQRRSRLIEDYRKELQQAGIDRSSIAQLVKDFTASLPN